GERAPGSPQPFFPPPRSDALTLPARRSSERLRVCSGQASRAVVRARIAAAPPHTSAPTSGQITRKTVAPIVPRPAPNRAGPGVSGPKSLPTCNAQPDTAPVRPGTPAPIAAAALDPP